MSANLGKPVVTDPHVDVLAQLRVNQLAVAKWFDGEVPVSPPEGIKRWNSVAKKFERLLSGVWADLAEVFEITVRNALSLGGRSASEYWHQGNLNKNEFAPASLASAVTAAQATAVSAGNGAASAQAQAASAASAASNALSAAGSAIDRSNQALAVRIIEVGAVDVNRVGLVLSPVPPGYILDLGRLSLQLQASPFTSGGFRLNLVRVWYEAPFDPGSGGSGDGGG
jgi:hypothetical protein